MKLGNRFRTQTDSCCGQDTCRPANSCDSRRVTAVTKAGDKVIIVLDDCSYLQASFSVVDQSVLDAGRIDNASLDELREIVEEQRKQLAKLQNSLVTINKLNGDNSFLAISPDYQP